MIPRPRKYLLLGESGVGKTHYGAQLLLRLNQGNGELRMRGAASNLRPFQAALDCLNKGKAADHTPTSAYLESLWPVVSADGHEVDLVWPDYGGEQVLHMVENRRIPTEWRDRLQKSCGWIVFVRVHKLELTNDIFSRPVSKLGEAMISTEANFKVSDQARLVELLQMLLFISKVDLLQRIDEPTITVVVTCWDELGDRETLKPSEMLQRHLPLLSAFLSTNWKVSSLTILGLSALEKPLLPNSHDKEYVHRGPESFGYVVKKDGSREKDLTYPIARLARKLR